MCRILSETEKRLQYSFSVPSLCSAVEVVPADYSTANVQMSTRDATLFNRQLYTCHAKSV